MSDSTRDDDPSMYVPRMDAFLNRWFTTYEEARAALDADGGYLLPCGDQFFVSTPAAICELGLDPDDEDWKLIGGDWVRPADRAAWERLRVRREIASHV